MSTKNWWAQRFSREAPTSAAVFNNPVNLPSGKTAP
jgi:hypothetical protein